MLFVDSPKPTAAGAAPGLVGIARMAAESEVLDAKKVVEYFEIGCRTLLNRPRPGLPFAWSINPYRGCEFGCRYCYARYTHEFMELRESEEFEKRIFAKSGVAEALRRDLKKLRAGEGVAIGTATDPYQPAERRYGRTRAMLEVFAEGGGREIAVTTKSDLVKRDAALLAEIGKRNSVSVNITITTLDAGLARLLEPKAPRPELRLGAVEALAKAGVAVGVFANPVMPLITDQEAKLDRLAKAARDRGAEWFGGGTLFLQPCARRVFFPFVAQHYPHLLRRYEERFGESAYLRGAYADAIRERVAAIRERYGLRGGPERRRPEPGTVSAQQWLF